MARKPTDAAKAKAAKQKKILIGLSVVLVLALGYAYHTMQGLNTGGSTPVAAAATPAAATPAAATPAAATPAATPATPTGSATPAVLAVSQGPTVLVSAVRPAADSGQLQSFSRFESKDPFAAGGPKPPTSTAAPTVSASAPAASAAQTPDKAAPTQKQATPPAPPPTAAVIAVNGVAGEVAVNADFPVSTDPTQNGLFHLVGLTAKTATVSVVGGSYATGAETLTLKVNRPVTLVNTADGKRYTLQLFPQGTPAPAAPTTGAPTTGAPTTTTATGP